MTSMAFDLVRDGPMKNAYTIIITIIIITTIKENLLTNARKTLPSLTLKKHKETLNKDGENRPKNGPSNGPKFHPGC